MFSSFRLCNEWRKALCTVKKHAYMLYKGHKTVFDDETSLEKCIRLLVLLVKGAKKRMIKIEYIE